jgi:hypothetical protein
MEPNTVGRKFGIGLRVASRMLMERAAQSGQKTARAEASRQKDQQKSAPLPQVYAHRGKAVARGARKFGEAIWKPVVHASGIIWLQITGLFFSVFALVFASNTYKLRQNWSAGPGHARFITYAIVALIFAYFAGSSFYRASKRQRGKSRH